MSMADEWEKAAKYKEVQDRLRRKLKPRPCTNREEAYNEGILAAMSIIKDVYDRQDTKKSF